MRKPAKEPAALISAMEISIGVNDKQRFQKILDVAKKLSGFDVSGGKILPAERVKNVPAAHAKLRSHVKVFGAKDLTGSPVKVLSAKDQSLRTRSVKVKRHEP